MYKLLYNIYMKIQAISKPVRLPKDLLDTLTTTYRGKGEITFQVTKAIKGYIELPIIVFSAYCEITDKIYYGLTNRYQFFDERYYYNLIRGDSPFSKELDLRGCNEFDFKPVGSFKNMREALAYREYLINKRMNEGGKTYNLEFEDMPFTRYISIPMNQNTLMKFLTICRSKGAKGNSIIAKMIRNFIKKNS